MKTKGGPRRVFECPLPECPFIAMSTMALKVLFNIIVQTQRHIIKTDGPFISSQGVLCIDNCMNMIMSTSKNLNIK